MFPSYLKNPSTEQKAKVLQSFSKITRLVKNDSDSCKFDIEEFAWAWFTVNTRAVYYKNTTRCPKKASWETNISDDHDNLALAPFLDMFNHSSTAKIEAGMNLIPNPSRQFYEIITKTEYKKYDQVFINYGPHGNLRLYVDYGFVEDHNQNDFVPVVIDEIKEIFACNSNIDSNSPIIQNGILLVERNRLHQNMRIDYNGPSWNIAASFFIMNNLLQAKEGKSDQMKVTNEWQSVFEIEDFSGYNDVAFLLLTLIKSKSNEIAQSIDDIQSKLLVPSNAGSMATTNSFIMAHNLLKLHFYMLEGAVKCLAQS